MSLRDFFSRKSLKGDSHIYTYPVYSQEFSSFAKFNDYGRSKLDDYWKAYIDYGIVFASIETIAVNTVMTGYTIHSDNEEAKKAVEEFLHNSKLIEKRILPNIRFTLIFGDSISEKYYNEDGYFTDLLLRDPRSFDMIFDKYGMITGYLQKHGVFSSKSKEVIIPPEKIVHFQFFSRPDSPWGISLIAPSYETIVRKNSVDEATATAVIRHGHPKYVITILGVKDSMQKRIPDDEYQKIRRNLTNLDAKKEILIPDTIKIDNIDIKGVQHVEEYFNYFTQLLTAGLMVPEEAVGLGRNITEATSKTKIVMFERFIASIQRYVESKIENEIIPEILENYGIDRNTRVYIRFRGITEKDEAVKARWLSSILNAFPDKKPFTINEVRAMFGFPPIEGGDEL